MSDPAMPVFATNVIQVVCISDTHNDDPRSHSQVPLGDIFVHAGDLTDNGTFADFSNAFQWISALPHSVKIVIAGNNDGGLDRNNSSFSPESLELFTSAEAQRNGIHYLDRETRTVAYFAADDGTRKPIRVYGNPLQPEFLGGSIPFTYRSSPSEESTEAWKNAPSSSEDAQIWVTHSPPLGRLDAANVPVLTGCAVLAEKIASARPGLCVFGHYHYSWGVERVRWQEGTGIARAEILSISQERREEEKRSDLSSRSTFDFSGWGPDGMTEVGNETIFVNAGWMTTKKRQIPERNQPIVVRMPL